MAFETKKGKSPDAFIILDSFVKEDELFWLCIMHRIWQWTRESTQLHTLTLLIIFRRAFSRHSDIHQAENYSRSRSSEENSERFCLFILDLNEDKLLSLLLQQMPQNFIRKTFAPTKPLNLHPWKFLPLLNLLDKTNIFPPEEHWHAASVHSMRVDKTVWHTSNGARPRVWRVSFATRMSDHAVVDVYDWTFVQLLCICCCSVFFFFCYASANLGNVLARSINANECFMTM